MTAIQNHFDAALQDKPSPVTGKDMLKSRLEDLSLSGKLRLAILGIAIVPFAVSALLLSAFGYFGYAGANHQQRVAAEIEVAEAAMAMTQVADLLRTASRTNDQAAIELGRSALTDAGASMDIALENGSGKYPPEILASMRKIRSEIELHQADLQRLNGDSSVDEFSAVIASFDTCVKEIKDLFETARGHATLQIESLLEQIKIGFIVCFSLAFIAACISIRGARLITSNIVGLIHQMKEAMERLAGGETDIAIPGEGRSDELGAMARALGIFRKSAYELQQVTKDRAHEAEIELGRAQDTERLRAEKAIALRKLADDFEASIFESTRFVAEASNELQTTSSAMSDLAEESTGRAADAAKAMEQAALGIRGSSLEVGSAAAQMLKSSEETQRHAELLQNQAVQFLEEVRQGYQSTGKVKAA
ncbi:MAG: methyl-accepting chemotaxis protein [Erythrobacter sp.]